MTFDECRPTLFDPSESENRPDEFGVMAADRGRVDQILVSVKRDVEVLINSTAAELDLQYHIVGIVTDGTDTG